MENSEVDYCNVSCYFQLTFHAHNVFYFYSGTGAGMDVVVSSVKAYIAAINKMLSFKETPSAEKIPVNASNVS